MYTITKSGYTVNNLELQYYINPASPLFLSVVTFLTLLHPNCTVAARSLSAEQPL